MSDSGIFIVGCPRSGTSLLHHVINSHPDAALGLERYNLKVLKQTTAPEDFEEDNFFNIKKGQTWYDSFDVFPPDRTPTREKYSQTRYRGDKVPRGYLVYDHLFKLFSDTRVLFIFRNIFSVAASYEARRSAGTGWQDAWDSKAAVGHWNDSLELTAKAMSKYRILPVFYNDLLQSVAITKRIAGFLDIEPGPLEIVLARERQTRIIVEKKGVRPKGQLDDFQADHIIETANMAGYAEMKSLCAEMLVQG